MEVGPRLITVRNFDRLGASFNSKVIYDLSNTQHVKESLNKHFYVQAATFKNIKNANIYKQQLRKKTHQPVTVKARGKYYVVIIGPLNSVAEVRALSSSSRASLKTMAHEHNEPIPVSKHKHGTYDS